MQAHVIRDTLYTKKEGRNFAVRIERPDGPAVVSGLYTIFSDWLLPVAFPTNT